jgi:hypothetical protein
MIPKRTACDSVAKTELEGMIETAKSGEFGLGDALPCPHS